MPGLPLGTPPTPSGTSIFCLNEPQLSPIVYLRLEALLPSLLRLDGRLLPVHIVVCIVEVGGHINGEGENHGCAWGAY